MQRQLIKVIPRSAKNEITQLPDGSWKIKVTAAPVDGAANKAVVKLLSEQWGIAKADIRIIKGERGRKKVMEIE